MKNVGSERYKQHFKLEREVYQRMLKDYKDGDVTYVQIEGPNRNANVILMGADFDKLEVKNIYKALNLVKPDIVLLQVKPDLVLDKFKTLDSDGFMGTESEAMLE